MQKTAYLLISLIAIGYILTIADNIIIPFILAILIWFIVKDIRDLLNKVPFIKKWIPNLVQSVLVFLIFFGILSIISNMLIASIDSFREDLPSYQQNLVEMNEIIFNRFNFDVSKNLNDFIGDFEFESIIQPVLNSLTGILSSSTMIIIYVIFIIMEEGSVAKKAKLLFKTENNYQKASYIFSRIDKSFGRYISLKTLTSILTASLSFVVLKLLGINSAALWAIIIFLLNYIPSVGSLICTAFPTIIAFLQFGAFMPALWVLLGVGLIQIVVGNLLEPKIMGNTLNISPLVVILSLVVWGALWGVVGMFLSVPITVMLIIIFAQFESTKPVAILLSENGEVS